MSAEITRMGQCSTSKSTKSVGPSRLGSFGQLYSLMMKANGGQRANASHFARHAMTAERDYPEVFEQAHAAGLRDGVVPQDWPEYLSTSMEVAYRHGHAAGRLRCAHARGVAAGLVSKPREACPYEDDAVNGQASLRRVWLEARKAAGARS